MPQDRFAIGGCVFDIKFRGLQIADWPHPFYTPFLTRQRPDCRIVFNRSPKSSFTPKQGQKLFTAVFNKVRDWEIYQPSSKGYRVHLFDSSNDRCDKWAEINEDFSSGIVRTIKPDWHLDRLARPFLDLMLVNHLAPRTGFLMHASSVSVNGQGVLFSGYSGCGKTTMARFWHGRDGEIFILNDERTVVRKESNMWKVYGTPWPGNGYMVSGQSAPLKAIFLIRHAKKNQLRKLGKLEAYTRILSQIYAPYWSRKRLQSVTAAVEELIHGVDCYDLGSRKDIRITHDIERWIGL